MVYILIYQDNVKKAYLYLIKENLSLIKKLLEEKENFSEPYSPDREFILYKRKAKHFQIMNLIGSTAEHLIKIILLKRGFILNEGSSTTRFSSSFMSNIETFNNELKTQEKLDELYNKALQETGPSIKEKLIKFNDCICKFEASNPQDYFSNVGTYLLNPHPEVYDGEEYFGYKEIKPNQCLRVIQKARNSYTHLLEAREEQNDVVWYFINFLIWLAKKEYPDFFNDEEYISSEENKRSH